jgi:glutathione S-transferase
MTGRRLLVHAVFLYLLPLAVAIWGMTLPGATALVVLMLLWRWAITMSGWVRPARVPELELESISASHYVEKVRWSMDRLGLEYTERQVGGTLGAFFLGRTVPQLKVRTGAVRSVIGNSPEILRYLWGAYGETHAGKAEFLRPTPERLALEKRLDRYGVDLQVWVYYHILQDRDLSLRAWGAGNPVTPAWQRMALRALFPVLRYLIRWSFRITDGHYAKAVEHIETTLADVEQRIDGESKSILGDNMSDYVDITFASLSGLWLQPSGYAGGRADAVRISRDIAPPGMKQDVERWVAAYPRCVAFIERLYAEERKL